MPLSETEVAALRESMSKHGERIATLEANGKTLDDTVKTLAADIVKTYVTLKEFGVVKMIAFGFVITVLGAFMTALSGKVFLK